MRRYAGYLDAVPIIWLAFVLASYAGLALFPFSPALDGSGRPLPPGPSEAERLVLPLLACLGATAIIRYFAFRRSGPAETPGADSGASDA